MSGLELAFLAASVVSALLMCASTMSVAHIARNSDSPDERAQAWAVLAVAALLLAAFAAGMLLV